MKNFGLIALAASAKLAFAHTTIYAAWINGEDQGLGNSADGYIRSPPNNNPLKDVTSKDLTCNVNNVATAKTLSVASGDKFTFEWHHNNRDAGDDIIDPSHKGPVMVYIAPTEAGTAGNGWVKIYEDGYNPSTKKWAVDTLIANKGQHSITIPNIAAGDYLLRAEIIALHEGDRIGGAQLYMECVQVKVTSEGTTTLPAGVSIPGAYKATDAGINFNLYGGFTSYPIPGPSVWDGASGSKPAATSAAASSKPAATSAAAVTSKAATSSVVANTQVVETPAPTSIAPSSVAATSAVKPATSAVAVSSVAQVSSAAATSAVKPTTFATIVKTTAKSAAPAPTPTGTATGTVAIYHQCGGSNYSGSTTCEKGSTCKEQNPYYSQCVSSS